MERLTDAQWALIELHLVVRHERKVEIPRAFIQLACAVIGRRRS